MGKKLLIVVLLAALAPLSTASAAGMDAKDVEQIVVDLERVIGRLEGVDFSALKVRDHGNGLKSLAIPLPESVRNRLLAASASDALAKDFKAIAAGLQLTEPTSASILITAALAQVDVLYNFWWAVVSLKSSDQVKKTTFQMKGPGKKFKIVDEFLYPENAIQVYWTEQRSGDFGFHTIQAKVVGGGKAKTLYFAAL